ncbi:LamG domain-containing protein [Kineosporia succinea]|uniref:Beta-glucanase (GH16 family) n=1 Tax=Kineosporia succinea TaxID=84632 RepID=A0ABT9PDZ3_9ACTN|nr:hypothetical protein [Kineosporia succinea]MDP9830716.1 beta-glucanase (GH16 family) [Kineosporia succinea]
MRAQGRRITAGVATALVVVGTVTAVQAQASEPAHRARQRPSATSTTTPATSPATSPSATGVLFRDDFTSFDTTNWSCEYDCPVIEGEKARYRLRSGVAPDNYGSWSKSRYKGQRFTEGTFTVSFSLTERPKQNVWWGVALWDQTRGEDQFNEINFGYTTNQSYTNTQLLFESAKRGQARSVKVDTGVDLYDGQYHEATLQYDRSAVKFFLDGTLLSTISDPQYIPTDPMDLVLGPRLVTGSQPLTSGFTQSIDRVEISR